MLGAGSRASPALVVGLALSAVVAAGLARDVVFHLTPEEPERSARRFAGEAADVEIDPRAPWARLPRFLPGTADRRGGGRAHAVVFPLRPRPARPGVFRLCLASDRPARVTVAVDGVPVTGLDVSADSPRCQTTPISAAVFGRGGRLALVNDSPPTVYLENAGLADTRRSFAWTHYARPRLPAVPGTLLAASLVALLFWHARGASGPDRPLARSAAASLALALVALALLGWPASLVRLPRGLWVALPFILIGLGRPWRPARPRPPFAVRMRLLATRSALVAVGTTVAILAAEGLARVALRDVTTARNPRAALHRPVAVPEKNPLGFRERSFSQTKPAGTYRIAVLGDSLTWGVGVAVSAERFSNLLERYLNERRGERTPVYEVLNFGFAGWDTQQEVAALPRVVWPINPDFVLLQWYINDFENGDHSERPRSLSLLPWPNVHERLYHGSVFYALAEEQWEWLQERLGLVETYSQYLYGRFGDPEDPHSTYAIDQMRAFFAECRQHGTPVAVVLFPHVEPSLVGGQYVYAYLHDRVLAVCREQGVVCVDLRAAFARFPDYRVLWADPFDPHPSPLAHRLAAEQLLEALGPTWLAPGGRSGAGRGVTQGSALHGFVNNQKVGVAKLPAAG